MPRQGAREDLLQRAVAFIAERGVTDLSLRELATAIGTSHRMLIHHFGSREGLWVEVVRAVEADMQAALAGLMTAESAHPSDAVRAWWQHISDPALANNTRLFFELYGQALQGRPGTTALLDRVVDAWIEPAAQLYVAAGMEPGRARVVTRLGIALTRGLLLDLLATGDRAATTAALEEWIALVEAALPPR